MTTLRNRSNEPDGASAEAHEFDTVESYSTGGAKVLVFKNGGVEKAAVDKNGNIVASDQIITVDPSEGGAGIQAAYDKLKFIGGTIQLLEGTYTVSTTILPASACHDVTLRGAGDGTVLDWTGSVTGALALYGSYHRSNEPIDPFSAGDTSIFVTTPANAVHFQPGYKVLLHGDGADGHWEREHMVVKTAGNIVTGEVELINPIRHGMGPNVQADVYSGNANNVVRDLKIKNSSVSNVYGLVTTGQWNTLIENVTIEDFGNAWEAGISMSDSSYCTIRNCRVFGPRRQGMRFDTIYASTIENNFVKDTGSLVTAHRGAIRIRDAYETTIRYNSMENSYTGLYCYSGNVIKRCRITNNVLRGIEYRGIEAYMSHDTIIANNSIEYVEDNVGILFGGAISNRVAKNNLVSGNIIKHTGSWGITGTTADSAEHLINANILVGCAYGIKVAAEENNAIVGNVLREIGSAAIMGQTAHAVIAGNYLKDCGAVGGWPGISLEPVDYAVVHGNMVTGSVGGLAKAITLKRQTSDFSEHVIVYANHCDGEGIELSTGVGNISAFNKE